MFTRKKDAVSFKIISQREAMLNGYMERKGVIDYFSYVCV